MGITNTHQPPYYAVIFTSIMNKDDSGYDDMAKLMMKIVAKQKGFIGVESVREEIGITVSYWKDLESIKAWKEVSEHQLAQKKGKTNWYKYYKVRIAKVERDYEFNT